jgi:hypothetical protein
VHDRSSCGFHDLGKANRAHRSLIASQEGKGQLRIYRPDPSFGGLPECGSQSLRLFYHSCDTQGKLRVALMSFPDRFRSGET